MTTTKERRKAIPLRVKLAVALRTLGYKSEAEIQWDHFPALGYRTWDDAAQDYIPRQNDPGFIQILPIEDHRLKTFGTKATTAGSDVHGIAKGKRLGKETAEFRQKMIAKEPGQPRQKSSKIKSRGFAKSGSRKWAMRPMPIRGRDG